MAFLGETDKMHNIVYILIVLISCTSADVAFVTRPPEEVRTFPGRQVTLPCVVEKLPENHSVRWLEVENTEFIYISDNRDVYRDVYRGFGENFSISGDGMNFTLLFNIPDNINFGSDGNVTTLYMCSVIKPNGNSVAISANSKVIIQRLKILNPICGEIKTYYVIGETLTVSCHNDSDPTIITTMKSGNGKVLPTYLDETHIFHKLILTKEDHNAMFVCELRRNGTNEINVCSMGPITVNYKPEINITQTSQMAFHCTAEARPPVNETHWIIEPSIPKDSFTISNGVLTIIKPMEVESEMRITCEAENAIGKGNKTLCIPTLNNRNEEDGSGNIPTVTNRDEDGSGIIPVVNNRDEDDGSQSTSVIIVVICVLFCVVVAFIIIFLFLKRKRIKNQQTSKSRNMSVRFRSDDPQVELKNKVHDYAAIDVNEFRTDYQETENEIYVGGDMLSNDDINVANKKQSNTKLKDLDQIIDNVNRANTNCEKLKNEQQVYSQVNETDYKECENEIYQGPE
ncbi:uncharacterized protein LOC117108957 [Anneissia japonica]|uniref:uncharacterized protein LOC117108957 n=1 Tax=Anneissia japonica TaxID=1529436 RepID=UPI001425790F|nr:uncharacterized protein LOC117108957 [Anneissia japonica]